MGIKDQIEKANTKLKAGRVGVTISVIGNRLYLRGSFPPKPGSGKLKKFNQRLSTGKYANQAGVMSAEKLAREVGGLLAADKFDWRNFTDTPLNSRSCSDWCKLFKDDYFQRRELNKKSDLTWRTEYQASFSRLPQDKPLTTEVIEKAILSTKPDTRHRQRVARCLGALAKFAEINIEIKRLEGNYRTSSLNPRDLPSDEDILYWFDKLKTERQRIVYGVIALWGLRNHEAFLLDQESLTEDGLIKLKDGKTGPRLLCPLPLNWLERFGLRNIEFPSDDGSNHDTLGRRVWKIFQRVGVPFKPYDLRHCWARRAMLNSSLSVELAARAMGHSKEVHCRIYEKWISDNDIGEAFRKAIR